MILRFCLLPLVLVGGLQAHAANVVATYRFEAGFSPRPGMEQITIHDDGVVMFESEYQNPGSQPKDRESFVLARLDTDRVAAMVKKLDFIHEKDLIDEDQGKPMCAGAPSSTYSISDGRRTATSGEMKLTRPSRSARS
ncbi:MAG: hypothetical protein AB7G93_02915 [Bdellovibrionales bacterium]